MGPKLYGILFTSFAFSSFFGYTLQFLLFQVIGFQGLFILMTFLSVIALVFLKIFEEDRLWTMLEISLETFVD